MNDYEQRVRQLESAIEASPYDLAPRRALIELARQARDVETMLSQQMDCAELLLRQGEQQGAIQLYQTILEFEEHPACRDLVADLKPEIYLTYGEMFLENGQLDHAADYLRASRDLQPERPDTHLTLARCYIDQEHHREAIHELQEVLRLTPAGTLEQALPCELMAEVLTRLGQSGEVMFERAADLYAQAGQIGEAERVYRRYQQLNP